MVSRATRFIGLSGLTPLVLHGLPNAASQNRAMENLATSVNPLFFSVGLGLETGDSQSRFAKLLFRDQIGLDQIARFRGARLHAGRLLALGKPVEAQTALRHHAPVGPADRAERAHQYAARTADTALPVEQNGLVFPQAVKRRGRAYRCARRVFALLALQRNGPISNPDDSHPRGRLRVFQNGLRQFLGFGPADSACQFTTVAAHAFFQISHDDLHWSLYPLSPALRALVRN